MVLLPIGVMDRPRLSGYLRGGTLEPRLVRQVELGEEIEGEDIQKVQRHLEGNGLHPNQDFKWDLFGGRK